jgi:hypothetical protein
MANDLALFRWALFVEYNNNSEMNTLCAIDYAQDNSPLLDNDESMLDQFSSIRMFVSLVDEDDEPIASLKGTGNLFVTTKYMSMPLNRLVADISSCLDVWCG